MSLHCHRQIRLMLSYTFDVFTLSQTTLRRTAHILIRVHAHTHAREHTHTHHTRRHRYRHRPPSFLCNNFLHPRSYPASVCCLPVHSIPSLPDEYGGVGGESDMCACLPVITGSSPHIGVSLPTPPHAASHVCLLEQAIDAACLAVLSVALCVCVC